MTSVAAPEELDSVVDGYVASLLAGGPQALAGTKDLLRRVPRMDQVDAFGLTAEISAAFFSSDEAREGMTAFLEKRSAAWLPGE